MCYQDNIGLGEQNTSLQIRTVEGRISKYYNEERDKLGKPGIKCESIIDSGGR